MWNGFALVVGRPEVMKYPVLSSDAVDLLENSGRLDPQASLDKDTRSLVESSAGLFGSRAAALPTRVAFKAGPRSEYIRLVERQLRSGKVALMQKPKAVASSFTVGKPGKSILREIWNGSRITEAAEPPPKPPWQANPSALAELEATEDRPVWMFGRDARVFFDQLLAPDEIQPFLGRPFVTVAELLDGDECFTLDELQSFVLDGPLGASTEELTPVSRVWPMGFGWNSFID